MKRIVLNKKEIASSVSRWLAAGASDLEITARYLRVLMLNGMRDIRLPSDDLDEIMWWLRGENPDLGPYAEELEEIIQKLVKKEKIDRMSKVAIKAIATDLLKKHPELKYKFIEQKRRVRIKVKVPNKPTGIYIDAWMGSYREMLTEQIEELISTVLPQKEGEPAAIPSKMMKYTQF